MCGMNAFNTAIIEEFRANEGRVGGPFANATLLLLHHTGAKTGQERVNPLAYQKVGDGYAVFASKAGAPTDPAWYHNLRAHPETTIEVGAATIQVRARVASPSERDEIYARQVERAPQFGEYVKKAAPRVIPVVILDPIT
jgi:deazaflavin-dependent oxidoreductase (nitroreductase family)